MKIYGLAVVIFLHSGYNIPNAIFLHDIRKGGSGPDAADGGGLALYIRKGGSMAHRETGHPDTKDVLDPSFRPKKGVC